MLNNKAHTGYAAIENVSTIDERRSKIVRNRVLDSCCRLAIENIVSIGFDPRSSIVKSVLDCHLSGVKLIGFPPSRHKTLKRRCDVCMH